MKITKFTHSCLLVETEERVGLFDPGVYSSILTLDRLERLDDLMITHAHEDHFNVDFVVQLAQKFPGLTIVTVPLVQQALAEHGIGAQLEPTEHIGFFTAPHETMEPLAPPPDPNNGVHYLGRISHPGDAHHFSETKDVLALPITGPWGSWNHAAQLILDLKPKTVIPIHDWHLNDEARAGAYDRFAAFCAEHGATFIKAVDGQAFEL